MWPSREAWTPQREPGGRQTSPRAVFSLSRPARGRRLHASRGRPGRSPQLRVLPQPRRERSGAGAGRSGEQGRPGSARPALPASAERARLSAGPLAAMTAPAGPTRAWSPEDPSSWSPKGDPARRALSIRDQTAEGALPPGR